MESGANAIYFLWGILVLVSSNRIGVNNTVTSRDNNVTLRESGAILRDSNVTWDGCKSCHAISGSATDNWCTTVCNNDPPYCPSDMCKCDPLPPSPPAASIIGYYSPSWDKGSVGPNDATMGVAFTGWVDPEQAIDYSGPPIKGTKWVSVGGGNKNGKFTSSRLDAVINGLKAGTFSKPGYKGICFDVEEADSGLKSKFAEAFRVAKGVGMMVFVTTSHSAPYGADDGAELVKSWLNDDNIDFLSPQLYTSGAERCPDFEANEHLDWSAWRASRRPIVPSIVDPSHYALTVSWAKTQQFPALRGYIMWAEIH